MVSKAPWLLTVDGKPKNRSFSKLTRLPALPAWGTFLQMPCPMHTLSPCSYPPPWLCWPSCPSLHPHPELVLLLLGSLCPLAQHGGAVPRCPLSPHHFSVLLPVFPGLSEKRKAGRTMTPIALLSSQRALRRVGIELWGRSLLHTPFPPLCRVVLSPPRTAPGDALAVEVAKAGDF